MKPQPNPPRLIDSPEFGSLVEPVANRRWSPERLLRSGRSIDARVAGLTAAGAVAVGAAAAGAGVVAIKAAVVAKIGLPLILGATVVASVVLWEADEEPGQEIVEEIVSAPLTEPAPAIEIAPVVEEELKEELEQETEEDVKDKRKRPSINIPRPAPARPKPKSTLPDQLGLFDAARSEAAAGAYAKAIAILDQLRERFPDTPLLAEVFLSRAEYLVRSGRDKESLAFIESILDDARVANKKAQLLRLVGDIWLRRGVCQRAVPAYQRALGLGLPDKEARVARAGLKKCRRP